MLFLTRLNVKGYVLIIHFKNQPLQQAGREGAACIRPGYLQAGHTQVQAHEKRHAYTGGQYTLAENNTLPSYL